MAASGDDRSFAGRALPRPALIICAFVLSVASAAAQPPQPTDRVGFQQAIDRAIANNPTVAVAAAGILRAEGLLAQARSAIRPFVNASVTTTTLNTGVEFAGSVVSPRNQVTASLTADMPVLAGAAWAQRAQAQDTKLVAELNAADVRRQIALATADAYLTILAQHRVVDANLRARETAKAHFDLATQLEQRGTGSRLNMLRAQQQFSTDSALVEAIGIAMYRSQEALGVLLVANGPVDTADEPSFDLPADATAVAAQTGDLTPALLPFRTDLKLFSGQVRAAERVVRDSSRDWWPTVDAIFVPQTLYPTPFFSTANSWRFLLQANIPVFDSGQRASQRVQRQAALDAANATLTSTVSQASSQVRAAREAVASGQRTLALARAAADQAQQVVDIVNVSFRAGAATNIEVIDAQRTARDLDTAVAAAEDTLRRARLELLEALGRFP